MGHFGIASYESFNDEGHAILYAENVDSVL